jgi:hypothetical protein
LAKILGDLQNEYIPLAKLAVANQNEDMSRAYTFYWFSFTPPVCGDGPGL